MSLTFWAAGHIFVYSLGLTRTTRRPVFLFLGGKTQTSDHRLRRDVGVTLPFCRADEMSHVPDVIATTTTTGNSGGLEKGGGDRSLLLLRQLCVVVIPTPQCSSFWPAWGQWEIEMSIRQHFNTPRPPFHQTPQSLQGPLLPTSYPAVLCPAPSYR